MSHRTKDKDFVVDADGQKIRKVETWNCSTCQRMNLDKRRNCKFLKTYNSNRTKIQAVVGFNKYYTCPLSLIQDSDQVFQVIQLIDWMDNSHIPITGTCILDQSPITMFYRSVILSERDVIDREADAMTPITPRKKR